MNGLQKFFTVITVIWGVLGILYLIRSKKREVAVGFPLGDVPHVPKTEEEKESPPPSIEYPYDVM
jgi:hypothetical protein